MGTGRAQDRGLSMHPARNLGEASVKGRLGGDHTPAGARGLGPGRQAGLCSKAQGVCVGGAAGTSLELC